MSSFKTLTRSFAGGEITPEMYGRLDNVKFQTGLALCRNAFVLPHGPVTKRPGFAFVNYAGVSAQAVRLIPFAFSADQTMVIELGVEYVRFHTLGATLQVGTPPAYSGATTYGPGDLVSDAGVNYYCVATTTGNAPPNATFWYAIPSANYQIPSPYAAADLFALRFTQSADVLTITGAGYRPRELRRLGATQWVLNAPTLGAAVAMPGVPTVAVTVGTGTAYNKSFFYKVTAVSADGSEESLSPGASAAAVNDLTLQGAKNVVSYTASGATTPSYRIYKAVNDVDKLYGFIGETTGLSFTDDNITPDYSHNPPASTIRLDTAGNYPTAVTYYEQRRAFAGTANNPQTIYMTRVGTESNLSVSNPGNSDDALSFSVKAQQQNAVKHLVPLNDLLALTAGGVWRITSTDGALTPETISTKSQTFYGASDATPALTGHSCLYAETNGRRLRDIGYSWEAQAFTSDDRSVMAPHLFLDYTIIDMAYSKSPDQLLWCVRSDGVLLTMAYVPEHKVFGWSQNSTDGTFESVCVVSENNEDVLYAVVQRSLGVGVKRCIERLATRRFGDQVNAFYVDCGLTYDGAPADTISGLDHLNGKAVAVCADGAVVPGLTVSGGAITLPADASVVHVGLPYTADLQLLPLAIDGAEAGGQGTIKAVDYAYIRVHQTGPLLVGPAFDDLTEVPIRTDEPYGSPPRLQSRTLDIFINPGLGQDAQLCIRSEDPVPLTVSSVAMKVTLGG
jgi:hypothetical protein